MIGKVTIINPQSGAGEVLHYSEPLDLEDMQKFVGGLIEIIPHFTTYKGEPCLAICNKEGKLNGLLPNKEASVAWFASIGRNMNDVLVGDVAVIQGDDEFMGEL